MELRAKATSDFTIFNLKHRIETFGAVAQLARAPRSHRGGQGFDSPQLHKSHPETLRVYESEAQTMLVR